MIIKILLNLYKRESDYFCVVWVDELSSTELAFGNSRAFTEKVV